jgi:two-component sensor histidine kinase
MRYAAAEHDARGTMSGPAEATNRAGGHRVLEFAWGETPIGPSDQWPGSLRAAVDLMLGVGAPSALFVGPQLIQMHNPAFGALYRDERSAGQALGRSLKRDDGKGSLTAAAAEVFAGRSFVLRERRLRRAWRQGVQPFLCAGARRARAGQRHAGAGLSDRRAADAERSPLMGELQHRVRNILAVVRSLVARSAETSDTVEDLAAHLDGRIAALARVQAVLVRTPSAGVDLEIGEGRTARPERRRGEGCASAGRRSRLPSKAAEVLTLAIHELATNATKYGALSQASGNLEITWRFDDVGTPRQRLEIAWVETGCGSPAASASTGGFRHKSAEASATLRTGRAALT